MEYPATPSPPISRQAQAYNDKYVIVYSYEGVGEWPELTSAQRLDLT
jgi:hypothetical protein